MKLVYSSAAGAARGSAAPDRPEAAIATTSTGTLLGIARAIRVAHLLTADR
jgi:hypothetical protein